MKSKFLIPVFALFALFPGCEPALEKVETEVLVIGAGTGAVAAGIQSARSEAVTLLVNPLPWLGGMLTAAGVSATDGNHELPSGLWGEFRQLLRNHYGGPEALSTGWVSHTLFEPHIGEMYFRQLANAEEKLTVWDNSKLLSLSQTETGWEAKIDHSGETFIVRTKIIIDGTDLGDVAALAGVEYNAGMDSHTESGEAMAPVKSNDILQDLTYVAILKDFGEGQDKTIVKPASYNPEVFFCSCQTNCPEKEGVHACDKMLSYALLPNNKYMINWPIEGNDYYANVLDLDEEQRDSVFTKAKEHTLNFVYYIQSELGYKHLGLADDEFPTEDQLALLPYHREGRRIKGQVRLNVNHILNPHRFNLYRTGIAVGDYPIDHHHDKNPEAPVIEFPKVPSYNIPLGCLITKEVDNFLVADKAISVTNIVNGTTRLQPVILQIGQVAGAVAAMAVKQEKKPSELAVRKVQQHLLKHKVYLMPYIDVQPDHPHFEAIHRIGATGLLRGTGVAYKWANQTWFYPDTTVAVVDLKQHLAEFQPNIRFEAVEENLSIRSTVALLNAMMANEAQKRFPSEKALEAFLVGNWAKMGLQRFNINREITKTELAVLLDKVIDPFRKKPVDVQGNWLQ